MSEDKRAIRDLVDTWMAATEANETETVLKLMTDDVVFMVPDLEPFGKAAFEATSKDHEDIQIEGTCDIQELEVLGDWVFLRNYI